MPEVMRHPEGANEFWLTLEDDYLQGKGENLYVQDDDDLSCLRIGVGTNEIREAALTRDEVTVLRDVLNRWLEAHG